MSQIVLVSDSSVQAPTWKRGAGNVLAHKAKPAVAVMHMVLEENGRPPSDQAIIVQAAQGRLFPLIQVGTKALGLQRRYRPQLKAGASWERFIGDNFPESVDPSQLGRQSWTVTRWFGDLGDDGLKKAIAGDPAYQDPRLTIVTEETQVLDGHEMKRDIEPIVENDALQAHSTLLSYGLVDQSQPAAETPFGEKITALLDSLTWQTRREIASLRHMGELHCGFTLGFIGHLSLLNPDVF